ncbi:hypothetical protein FGO68_gene7219 [Halteria grandinella]|uniref:Uncharacterized protein n=1 Tax=Halteria grandinella TaxID=5974 RepID=A0A8J8T8I3_HALGN|nr:hypothetical protein FGO68_gene7219 [Halteria grandinella]
MGKTHLLITERTGHLPRNYSKDYLKPPLQHNYHSHMNLLHPTDFLLSKDKSYQDINNLSSQPTAVGTYLHEPPSTFFNPSPQKFHEQINQVNQAVNNDEFQIPMISQVSRRRLQKCGAVIPLSMTQRELPFDPESKISLFEKLIGDTAREAPHLKRNYVSLLLSQTMPNINHSNVTRTQIALEKNLPIPLIIGRDKIQPDAVVKEQARVHPVSSRKLEAIEDIVMRDTRNLSQWEQQMCIVESDEGEGSYLDETNSKLESTFTQVPRDTSQETLFPLKKLTSVSNLSRYLGKPLLDKIKRKCTDNIEIVNKIGSVSKVIQAQKHIRYLANLANGGLQSYQDEQLQSRSRLYQMNKRIRKYNEGRSQTQMGRKTGQVSVSPPPPAVAQQYEDQPPRQWRVLHTKSARLLEDTAAVQESEQQSIYGSGCVGQHTSIFTHRKYSQADNNTKQKRSLEIATQQDDEYDSPIEAKPMLNTYHKRKPSNNNREYMSDYNQQSQGRLTQYSKREIGQSSLSQQRLKNNQIFIDYQSTQALQDSLRVIKQPHVLPFLEHKRTSNAPCKGLTQHLQNSPNLQQPYQQQPYNQPGNNNTNNPSSMQALSNHMRCVKVANIMRKQKRQQLRVHMPNSIVEGVSLYNNTQMRTTMVGAMISK